MSWSMEEIMWIKAMNGLFDSIFGPDFFLFEYVGEGKQCIVAECSLPEYIYDHAIWEKNYDSNFMNGKTPNLNNEDVSNVSAGIDIVNNTKRDKDIQLIHSEDNKKMGEKNYSGSVRKDEATTSADAEEDSILDKMYLLEEDPNLQVQNTTIDTTLRPILQYPFGEVGAIPIYEMDLRCLEEGNWLNDCIVDFYLKYVSRNISNDDLKTKVHILSSFFYTKLVQKEKLPGGQLIIPRDPEKRYRQASSYTRHVNILEKDFIFIPICRSGHWFLVVVWNCKCMINSNQPEPRTVFSVLDSLSWVNGVQSDPKKYIEVDYLYSFFQLDIQYRYSKPANQDWAKYAVIQLPLVPQQKNSSDCGVFVVMFVEKIFSIQCDMEMLKSQEPLLWFGQEEATKKRKHIKELILNLQLT